VDPATYVTVRYFFSRPGVGAETHGLGGIAVGYVSREDQAGKDHFLIGDEVADFIFGHRCLREFGKRR